MSDDEFGKLVANGIDAIPEEYRKALDNVAVVLADEPTPEQRRRLRLCDGQTLFGLYEGIPKTKRGSNYSLVLPDKITIFKLPILARAKDPDDAQRIVKHTVWHEVAHHFGLNHEQIDRLDRKMAA